MSVYVDDMRAPYGRMIMCHMVADTREELHVMAVIIGVSRRWLQNAGTYREHFDVCLEKRAKAVSNGAIEITSKELGKLLLEKRAAAGTSGPKGEA